MLTKFEHCLMLEANFTLSRYNWLTNATVCLKSKLQFLKGDASIAVFIKHTQDSVNGFRFDVKLKFLDLSSKERCCNFMFVISVADSEKFFDGHIFFLAEFLF